MVKEGENKMNKGAIIQTQLYRELKALGLFLVVYGVSLGGFIVLQEYVSLPFNFDDFSYIFVIFLAVSTWVLTASGLKLYTYHSYSRQSIISRIAIVQLVISCLSSLLIVGHTWLMQIIPYISKKQSVLKVKNVYFDDLISNDWLGLLATGLLISLAIFCLLQLTTLLLVATYEMKRRSAILVLISIAVIVLGILISLPYWTNQMIGISIMILGFLVGTGQSLVPAVVLPIILLCLLTSLFFMVSRKLIKKIEVFGNSLN